jgi:hypothetical protein
MIRKTFASLAVIALILANTATASAATTVANTGNGVDSRNDSTVSSQNNTVVSQDNVSSITNSISVSSNTGDNDANRNTNGNVHIDTGDAATSVAIQNVANSNMAQVDACCDAGADVTVANEGNGDSSDNDAHLDKINNTALFQTNDAAVDNAVEVDANTGNNDANSNTGGDVAVSTGDALVGPLLIGNSLNSNQAALGSQAGHGNGGAVTLANIGNGVDTNNDTTAYFEDNTAALQNNSAWVGNYVGVTTNTGDNDANRNTNGDVYIDTGKSAVAAILDTRANFNAASLDNCGCVQVDDVLVKNYGNGDSADSDAHLDRVNSTEAFQNNWSDIVNYGEIEDNTGNNEASSNTGAVDGYSDPAIYTGHALVEVVAESAANENLLNSGNVAMPTPPSSNSGMNSNGWWMWYGYGWNN